MVEKFQEETDRTDGGGVVDGPLKTEQGILREINTSSVLRKGRGRRETSLSIP